MIIHEATIKDYKDIYRLNRDGKGTLQQYAGRLHRLFENKNEVQIYDYVDIHVRMLEKMYNKWLAGYASIGYKAKGNSAATESIDIIFDKWQ